MLLSLPPMAPLGQTAPLSTVPAPRVAPDSAVPSIAEIAAGPQPTRGAIDDHRAALAQSAQESGLALRLLLAAQGRDGDAAAGSVETARRGDAQQGAPSARPGTVAQDPDATRATGHDPVPRAAADLPLPFTTAPREVIPRDPAPEAKVIVTQ